MIAADLLSAEIPPLRTSDNGLKALTWMEEFKLEHLPIVNHLEYLGLFSEEDLYKMNAPEEALGAHELSLPKPHVLAQDHILEVLKFANQWQLSAVPVLNDQKHYLGMITLKDLVEGLAKIKGVQEPGAIIVLEVLNRDYSLSQIAQIVESNDAKITSVFLSETNEKGQMEVHIKLNVSDITGILATFERYSYQIKGSYFGTGRDDLDDRYDLLMNYLNM